MLEKDETPFPNNKSNIDGTSNIHLFTTKTETHFWFQHWDTLNDFFVNPRIHKKEEDFDNHPSIITTKGKSYRVDFAFMEITTENVTGCLLKINAEKYTDPDGSSPNI